MSRDLRSKQRRGKDVTLAGTIEKELKKWVRLALLVRQGLALN
jgi:hypothetical protein